ncbi:MAG: hypothetical protein ACI8TQ_001335 [Planctomycetota bacterium]|jgi:hypothetical protein
MKHCISALVALGLLATSSAAQTPATAKVVKPCNIQSPRSSLVAQPLEPITYGDSNNEIVIEMESQSPIGDWVEETTIPGFGGDSYFRWDGSNFFGTPNVDTLTYNFEVTKTDLYLIRLHVRHDDPDPSEENDCWARLNGGSWEKLYHNTGSAGVGVWTFNARYESTNDFPTHTLSAGLHTFEIAGRSTNFKIDRIHVLPHAVWLAKLSDPQSKFVRDRPIIGNEMSVEIDDPQGNFGLTPGAAMTGWYVGLPGAGYPCGFATPFGELLILGPGGATKVGPFQLWMGSGFPNIHSATIPNDVNLVGMKFISQAFLFQPGNFVLGDGLELNIGDI